MFWAATIKQADYDQETISMLSTVLERAVAGLPREQRTDKRKARLASGILAAAARGERDPIRLYAIALGVGPWEPAFGERPRRPNLSGTGLRPDLTLEARLDSGEFVGPSISSPGSFAALPIVFQHQQPERRREITVLAVRTFLTQRPLRKTAAGWRTLLQGGAKAPRHSSNPRGPSCEFALCRLRGVNAPPTKSNPGLR